MYKHGIVFNITLAYDASNGMMRHHFRGIGLVTHVYFMAAPSASNRAVSHSTLEALPSPLPLFHFCITFFDKLTGHRLMSGGSLILISRSDFAYHCHCWRLDLESLAVIHGPVR